MNYGRLRVKVQTVSSLLTMVVPEKVWLPTPNWFVLSKQVHGTKLNKSDMISWVGVTTEQLKKMKQSSRKNVIGSELTAIAYSHSSCPHNTNYLN